MAETGAIAAAEAASTASGYRVKFDRDQFLELVRIAKRKVIYRRRNMYFFAYDGFVMYCDKCEASDFSARVVDAIEFSNQAWTK